MKSLLLLLSLLTLSMSVHAQVSKEQLKKRKKIIKQYSRKGDPLIYFNDRRRITVKEFFDAPGTIVTTSSDVLLDDESKAKRTVIFVSTREYLDSCYLERRKLIAENYKRHEMDFFFGSEYPLILLDGMEISRDEYISMGEDKVAFANFYLSDFVKENYAPNGMVYVCSRAKAEPLTYNKVLPLPVNGRNYIDELERMCGGFYIADPSRNGADSFLKKKVLECSDSLGNGVTATLVVSCKVDTEGKVSPIVVERMENANEQAMAMKDKLIALSKKMIDELPAWEPCEEMLYNSVTNDYEYDRRAYTVRIYVKFGDTPTLIKPAH
ncbi:MAG: hypothetical protein KBT29_12190 [Prevotellaceae bacterium]|nr:hypothetical protein [Candidatus Minthosoma caballi]